MNESQNTSNLYCFINCINDQVELLKNFYSLPAKIFRSRSGPALRLNNSAVRNYAVIISDGDSASIAYLLRPHLTGLGFENIAISAAHGDGDIHCHLVVISRYLPDHWIEPLMRFRESGGRVVYFMDDDLFDREALRTLPRAFAAKVSRLALNQKSILEKICQEFWFGSPYLCAKYPGLNPVLVEPKPTFFEPEAAVEFCSIVYHGTSSHQQEIAWLLPIIKQLQNASDTTCFEISGDHSINKMYRSLPRTSIIHPMNWQNYFSYTSSTSKEIGLAPLLPSPFNAGRGPTKFFDFTRMGAVGIYTDIPPYSSFVRDGIDGILLPNDPALWVEEILKLANDAERRKAMLAAARLRLKAKKDEHVSQGQIL